ncbi:aspartate carbamoyltransferase [Ignisphaera sp. 4213-co]|uniref:Aspartate carbamoyltransferase n=1 Tax=Ignisphaera cupida TaxID=3050454 RepID=A0ABD4Z571_9CREN|nr:aspartate carbamoyltransferase [Ignisphaera sp. 4213-co]MDK6028466.1 aspartate carbamoyltransferase [Ignisphaera sp. 4213-co]
MKELFYQRDVISILDFNRESLEVLFEYADRMLKHIDTKLSLLNGKVVSLAFFEPSTRTRLSFEVAAKKLGADVISIVGEEASSVSKGESLADTIRMLDSYSNAIVIRHRYEGVAKYAAEIAEHPVINAGDGKQHHPTQTMIDLYTVKKLFNDIDGLVYGVLGDLRYGRATTSFLYGLSLFKPKKVYLISPESLRVREEVLHVLKERNIVFEERRNLEDVIEELDVLYVIRIQKERFPDPLEYEKVKGSYKVTLETLKKGKKNLKILHPLPKVDEIDERIDYTSYAAYFTQAKYGVPVRMALLALIFGVEP